ncbi:hypothetical protein HYFRA_00004059 [Hymenoscyphus fraxineus]|uniref:Uncharacterized protein n=1 Tax=Hymenoscyphus fraxineus TaxID=746836 RepID=A0A9N9KPH2_9HELO|nr:hypothetical protein HYFRA_00004059 [Hymenoscyphus fraxineus]
MDAHYPQQILRHAKSSNFQRAPANAQHESQKLRKSKSAYFHHATKNSQDKTPQDKTTETKTRHSFISKVKAAFARTSIARSHRKSPSQLTSKLQMTRLEYRLHALNNYSTPQQYHRIHLAAILFHPKTNKLLLVKDPVGNKLTIPETAMFARHSSLGEALSEALFSSTGLKISEVKREVLPVWEFGSSWTIGENGEGMKSVMLSFVVEAKDLEVARGDVRWVGEEEVEWLEMDRGMRNLVRWVFDERILEG